MPKRTLRHAPHALVALVTGAALVLAVPPSPASADPLPADYDASAHGDIVDLDAALLGGSLAGVKVGHSQTVADSAGAPAVESTSANVDVSVGGNPLPIDSTQATAPPSSDPASRTLAPVDLAPVASAGLVTGDVSASYLNDSTCVPAVAGERVLGSSSTTLAGASVLGVAGLVNTVQVGASATTSTTKLVDGPAVGDSVVAETRTTVGDIRLLGNAARIEVTSPVVVTASSDGTTGRTSFSDPVVNVVMANGDVINIAADEGAVDIPINLGLLDVDLSVSAFAPDEQIDGATATATLDAIVAVDLTIVSPVLGDLADVHLGVGPGSATATAPAGGVECNADADGDGLTNAQEVLTGTDPQDPDSDNDGLDDDADDADDDGLTNLQEVTGSANGEHGGVPTNPQDADSDDDGLSDGAEIVTVGSDPLDSDTDDGGVDDGDEVAAGTDPLVGEDDTATPADSDGDGLSDADEDILDTDPADADSDDDGLSDGQEVNSTDTDPLDPDTDDGGVNDGDEVAAGTDPNIGTDDLPPMVTVTA